MREQQVAEMGNRILAEEREIEEKKKVFAIQEQQRAEQKKKAKEEGIRKNTRSQQMKLTLLLPFSLLLFRNRWVF